ncbi:MAG: hypothetical protein QOG62_1580 [Thermoleophilaceae bacterium]|jgi:hypothetical protein|nr:hypothetical protein [Thermoleophilaceae bacterium]
MTAQRGQASVEVIGAVPALLLAAACFFQLLAVGAAAVLAGSAAQAGALELAAGGDPADAARLSLPAWQRAGSRVAVDGGRVTVTLRPPALLEVLADRLEVSSAAVVRAP